jgi:hypothetical protein
MWQRSLVWVRILESNDDNLVVKSFITELVETLNAIRTTKLEEGSIPRVDDCCPQYYAPFECIQNMSGICRKTDYPASTGQCMLNQCHPFAKVQ